MLPARLLPCALGIAVTAVSAGARAAPNVALEVERGPGASGCIDAQRLRASVERRLKRRVFDAARPPELWVHVRFEGGERYTTRVVLSDREGPLGHRELTTEARHCSALDDSLALVVALLVDTPPARPSPAPTQPPAETAPPRAEPRAEPTPIELPPETAAPRAPLRFEAHAAALLGVGLLPGVALGGELGLGLKLANGPWLRAVGELYAEREAHLSGGASGVRLRAVRWGLELCPFSIPLGPLEAQPCLGQRVGWLRASGFGFDQNAETTRLFYSLTLGAQGVLPLGGPCGLVLGAHGEFPFARDEFTARADGVRSQALFQVAPVTAVAKLGLRVEL